MNSLTLTIHGRVQGVNFRNTVKREADRRGITGWIRNEPGGEVTLEAHGDKATLEGFLAWISASPGFSRVDRASAQWSGPKHTYTEFKVMRASLLKDQARAMRNLLR